MASSIIILLLTSSLILLLLGCAVALLALIARSLREITSLLKDLKDRPVPLLEGIQPARVEAGSSASTPPAPVVDLSQLEARAKEALQYKNWDTASELIEEIRLLDQPGSAERADQLLETWSKGRSIVTLDLQTQLEAARTANDPNTVLNLHATLTTMLTPEDRNRTEKELVSWFMKLLMKRMRTGTVAVDVVELAERVAETFSKTTEGASLRASLGTLRRSAGLCPVCAQSYIGVEAACPRCIKARSRGPVPANQISPTQPTSPGASENSESPEEPHDPFQEFQSA